MSCNGPVVTATVTITTNGVAGGSATFTWFTNNDNGSQSTVGTSPITLAAGQTTQSFSASESFQSYEGAVNWDVTVSSSPASKGGNSSAILNPYSNGCVPS